MKRTAGAWMLLAALGGCMSTEQRPSSSCGGGWTGGYAAAVPGVQGPWGTPVPARYSAVTPEETAMLTAMAQHASPEVVRAHAMNMQALHSGIIPANAIAQAGVPPQIMQAGGRCASGACGSPMGGPGFGAGGAPMAPNSFPLPGAGGMGFCPGGDSSYFATQRTSVRFASPAGMKVSWYGNAGDGKPGFAANQITVPGRYNFLQASIYRMKLSNIANRAGLELYPTLEVVPSNAKTATFLAHSAVPVAFTDEDFEQVISGNFVVKVIYLPFPQFQDLATTGPDEVVSSRLEPGADPIAEAARRGHILLVVRMGNIDLEAPNSPAMDAPNPAMGMPRGMPMPPNAGLGPDGRPLPYGMMGQGRPMPPNPPMMLPGGMPTGPNMSLPGGMPMGPNMSLPGGMPTGPNMNLPPAGPQPPAAPTDQTAIPGNTTSKKGASSPYQQLKYEAGQPQNTWKQASDSTAPATVPENKPIWEKNWWSSSSSSDKK